jgi:hypothetical protein
MTTPAEFKIEWLNGGEPDAEGNCTATTEIAGVSGVQTFIGKSHKEVADKVLAAHAHATKKIKEMTRVEKPDAATPAAAPAPLTGDDRFRLTQELQDPTRAPEAVREIVERTVPAVTKTDAERQADEDEQFYKQEAIDFCAEVPEFYPCKANQLLFENYVNRFNLKPTKKTLLYVFQQLSDSGLLAARPAAAPAPPAGGGNDQPSGGFPPTVTTRQRGSITSTGLRNGDSSGQPPAGNAAAKYTKQQILEMSQAELDRRLSSEPGFRKLVDEMDLYGQGKKPQAQAQA